MSITVQAWVYQHSEARLADRLVLLAIADEADEDGWNAYPSQRRIAEKARVGQSTVRRCLANLEAAGEIVVTRPEKLGRGHYSTYIVLMGRTFGEEGAHIEHLSEPEKRAETRRNAPLGGADPLTLRPLEQEPLRAQRGTRIPDPFEVTKEMVAWVTGKYHRLDWEEETDKFCDHWTAKAGRDAVKVDWPATWRNWMRNAAKYVNLKDYNKPRRTG